MLLAVDIGNTNIVLGLFDDTGLVGQWRLATRRRSTADEYTAIIEDQLSRSGVKAGEITGAVLSCVVPSLKNVFQRVLEPYDKLGVLVVGPGTKTGMPIDTDDPREVGADRIVNAVAAYKLAAGAVIVVDFGTAVTCDYISPDGRYCGGAIAPGIGVSTDALFERAAKLPRVELARTDHVVGKNTVESLKAGIFFGFVSLVDGIVMRMKQEVKGEPSVVATGGIASIIAPHCKSIDTVEESLTLDGLKLIYEVNR